MKKNVFFASFLLGCISLSECHAWGLEDLKEEAISPLTTEAKYPVYVGAAVTASLFIFKKSIVKPFQKQQVRHKILGDSSKIGDLLGQLIPNALYIGGMAWMGQNGDPEGMRRAMGMFKATAYSSTVTTLLKYTVREPRPIDPNWRTSFPSGHTTTAFAFSGYVMGEHSKLAGYSSLLMATFVGYSRINDNKHWLHDVVAGAAIGWGYGMGMSKLQQRKKAPPVAIVPIYDSKTIGLSLYREF